MILTTFDALRIIKKNNNATFTFPIYDILSNNTTIAPKIPTLEAGSETTWLVDGSHKIANSQYEIARFLRELWEDIAAIQMNGETICERSQYGQPMLAINEPLFQQDTYDKIIEKDFIGIRTGRSVTVGNLSEVEAASLMRVFTQSRKEPVEA